MHDPRTQGLANAALARARQIGLTQAQIAQAVGLSQGQVSRILSGAAHKDSRRMREICDYVFSAAHAGVSRADVIRNDELIDALRSSWDGTPKHAKALAAVIRSLSVLRADLA